MCSNVAELQRYWLQPRCSNHGYSNHGYSNHGYSTSSHLGGESPSLLALISKDPSPVPNTLEQEVLILLKSGFTI